MGWVGGWGVWNQSPLYHCTKIMPKKWKWWDKSCFFFSYLITFFCLINPHKKYRQGSSQRVYFHPKKDPLIPGKWMRQHHRLDSLLRQWCLFSIAAQSKNFKIILPWAVYVNRILLHLFVLAYNALNTKQGRLQFDCMHIKSICTSI